MEKYWKVCFLSNYTVQHTSSDICRWKKRDVYKRQDTDCLRMVFLYLISKGCENMEKSLEQLKQEYEKTLSLIHILSVQVVVKTMNPYFYYSFPWLIVLIYLAILLIV